MNNVTTATFTGSGRKAEACPLFQYDFGQILKIEGLELPPLYEVDFGNDRSSGTSITVLGDADGVEIPNQLLETGDYVFAWIVLHEGEDDRETEYMVEIPVIRRAEPSDEEPTPEQMTIIEQLTAEVADLKDEISELGGLSDDVKQALLQIAAKVAYTDDDGQDYYDALEAALYPQATLVSISAVYTQSGTVYDTDTLDSLKADLVVTATYDDSTTETVTAYTLSGTLTEGTSTITVAYGGKTTAFTVTVTQAPLWDFTNGYSVVKANSSTFTNAVFRQAVTARACGHDPIVNKGYVFAVTDSEKYNLAAYDITDLTKRSPAPRGNVDGYYYQGGSKSAAWTTSDSVSSAYVWLALKKMDGTAFTDAELANGAEAVFTFTESNG